MEGRKAEVESVGWERGRGCEGRGGVGGKGKIGKCVSLLMGIS